MVVTKYVIFEENDKSTSTLVYDEISEALDDFGEAVRNYDLYNHLNVILFAQTGVNRKVLKEVTIEYKENDL